MAATLSCSCINFAVSSDKDQRFLSINSPPSTQLTAASAHVTQYKKAEGTSVGRRRKNGSKRDFVVKSADPETVAATTDLMSTFSLPAIPGFSLSADNPWWAAIAGLAVTIPIVLQRIMTVTKEVDVVAHTVEKIAESVDKATEEIEAALPEGGLKKMVNMVEDLAEETVKDAQKVQNIMHKVEEIDEKLESYLNKQQIKGAEKA
ncbi:uncharacterized protein [Primulina huaijiensis]|uniref:uncharacterized protein n=1 Tax=Primulina huaijiensis TaxID=1492673 RepID=UPI003CC71DA8